VDVPAETLTYSIIGGADAALFILNPTSGVLTFTVAPDFDVPADAGANNVYDVMVQVSDGNGGADTQAIAVTVTDANDAPVITSDGAGPTAAVNAAENQTAVTTVRATDIDVPADTLTYSISGGADAALFSLDPTSGVLTFTVAPDFESPADTDGDNVYEVTVQVNDGNGGVDTQLIRITVTNVQEGQAQLPPPLPGPTPPPDPGPRPNPEPPAEASPSPTGTAPVEFPGPLGGQSTTGRELSRGSDVHSVPDWSNVLDLPPFLRPESYGTTSEQIRSFSPDPLLLSNMALGVEFLQKLNSFSDDLEETTRQTIEERSFFVKTMKVAGLGFSAALVAWLVRGGALLTSLLASMPAWRNIDPISILNMNQKSREDWVRKLQEAADMEAREQHGFNQIFEPKTVNPSPPSSRTPPRSL
jgi:hypothetical protein